MRARILLRNDGSRNAISSPSFQGISESLHDRIRWISWMALPSSVAWKPVFSMEERMESMELLKGVLSKSCPRQMGCSGGIWNMVEKQYKIHWILSWMKDCLSACQLHRYFWSNFLPNHSRQVRQMPTQTECVDWRLRYCPMQEVGRWEFHAVRHASLRLFDRRPWSLVVYVTCGGGLVLWKCQGQTTSGYLAGNLTDRLEIKT